MFLGILFEFTFGGYRYLSMHLDWKDSCGRTEQNPLFGAVDEMNAAAVLELSTCRN